MSPARPRDASTHHAQVRSHWAQIPAELRRFLVIAWRDGRWRDYVVRRGAAIKGASDGPPSRGGAVSPIGVEPSRPEEAAERQDHQPSAHPEAEQRLDHARGLPAAARMESPIGDGEATP